MVAPVTGFPLTLHWYCGVVPPLTGVVLKVTLVPSQTVVAVAPIHTLTGSNGFTVMVSVFEVAGLLVMQEILDVSTQVTASLLAGMLE